MNYKQKIKHYRELAAPIHAKTDLELLKKVDPRNDQLPSFEHAPERHADRILYNLLDLVPADEIRNNRRRASIDKEAAEKAAQEEVERLAAEKEAEEKEFYLYTSSNLIREAERMFGEEHGAEKKQYAMTRIQNEAMASKVTWNPKLASMSIEQAVSLRNDYKNMDVPMSEIIKKEIPKTDDGVEKAEQDIKNSLDNVINVSGDQAKKIFKKIKKEEEDSVISVVED